MIFNNNLTKIARTEKVSDNVIGMNKKRLMMMAYKMYVLYDICWCFIYKYI